MMEEKKRKLSREQIAFVFLRVVLPILSLLGIPLGIFFLTLSHVDIQRINSLSGCQFPIGLLVEIIQQSTLGIAVFLAIFIFIQLIRFFHSYNGGKIFNGNSNVNYKLPYFVFWISSKILGFKKVQLVGIPIYMQHRLILRNTFEEIVVDSLKEDYPIEEKGKVDVSRLKESCEEQDFSMAKSKCLLIVEDTYCVSVDSYNQEIFSTISVISRNVDDRTIRKENQELVDKVRRQAFDLSKEFTEIYLIMTTNPKNNLKIAADAFRQFRRFGFEKIFVYQLNENRKYEKAYRIL